MRDEKFCMRNEKNFAAAIDGENQQQRRKSKE